MSPETLAFVITCFIGLGFIAGIFVGIVIQKFFTK